MSLLDKIGLGMALEKNDTVTPEIAFGRVVPDMPAVYSTHTMIVDIERASDSAIQSSLPEGYVSLGMTVRIRHLAPLKSAAGCGRRSDLVRFDKSSVKLGIRLRKTRLSLIE